MQKSLFLIFHGFAEHNGISKKIFCQVDALRACGQQTDLCYTKMKEDGGHLRMIDDKVLKDYGSGIRAKIAKRFEYGSLVDYIIRNGIEWVYMRYDHNAGPALIGLLKKLKKAGIKVVAEIPTWPYDQEYKGLDYKHQLKLLSDKLFRKKAARYIYRFITFSDARSIWNIPTINISNGIDFSKLPVKSENTRTPRELHLTGVADIHRWHGFDRVLLGLGAYYKNPGALKVYFHIVGGGVEQVMNELHGLTDKYKLNEYVFFHGPRFGDELNALFERTDIGIASLARHRSNITTIKTLKNREYAARGIPFVYSEEDSDFDGKPYVLKAEPDDSPLDIQRLIAFYESGEFSPSRIRESVKGLDWKVQMQKVIDEVNSLR